MGLYRRTWRNSDGKLITSPPWWIAYMVGGKQHCESTGTSNKRVAQKILDIRRAEIAEGRFSSLLKSRTTSPSLGASVCRNRAAPGC